MSPIAAMMTNNMMLATRNRGGAYQRRRQPRGADQNSRTRTAEIRQATARRRQESVRRRHRMLSADQTSADQMRDSQSSRERDAPIVMAYPVLFDSGDAQAQMLPLSEPPPPSRPAISDQLRSSGDRVPPHSGGGDWVPPHLRRALDLATPEESQARAAELAYEPADAREESTKRCGRRRRRSGLGWLQCCYSAQYA